MIDNFINLENVNLTIFTTDSRENLDVGEKRVALDNHADWRRSTMLE